MATQTTIGTSGHCSLVPLGLSLGMYLRVAHVSSCFSFCSRGWACAVVNSPPPACQHLLGSLAGLGAFCLRMMSGIVCSGPARAARCAGLWPLRPSRSLPSPRALHATALVLHQERTPLVGKVGRGVGGAVVREATVPALPPAGVLLSPQGCRRGGQMGRWLRGRRLGVVASGVLSGGDSPVAAIGVGGIGGTLREGGGRGGRSLRIKLGGV